MIRGKLTPKEEEILHQLLMEKGITTYEILRAISEGHDLPGCTFPHEIETMSGAIVTADAVYSFWLDWKDDQYFFWGWHQYSPETVQKTRSFVKAQKLVRQRYSTS
jgi:hypothetical protein